MQSTSLTNQFLIAMPGLADPNFFHTVTYICTHNEDGAMGIVINRPAEITLGEIFQQMEISSEDENLVKLPIFQGGPVQADRGFVIHEPLQNWEYSIQVCEEIGVATSRDILQAIAHGSGPPHTLVALGYAGWAAGQLEQEIRDNAWLHAPADSSIIFNIPIEKRWEAAVALTGVKLDKLSSDVGHA